MLYSLKSQNHYLKGGHAPHKKSLIGLFYAIHNKVMLLLKGVFAKNERGYRLNAIKKRF